MRGAIRMAGLAVAAVIAMAGGSMTVANAQSPAVSVAVPAPGGGGGAQGCWRITQQIYGPYNMSFCLNPRGAGTYRVTGGGLNCNGRLDWYANAGNRTEIDLYRASCGSGTDWTGDSLSCRGTVQSSGAGTAQAIIGGAIAGAIAGGLGVPAPQIAVPSFGTMGCTYRPAAGGYAPISVTARRT